MDEAWKTLTGFLMWGSFSAHVVEDLCTGDVGHLCGVLPSCLSLQDLSWCLDEELSESLSWDPWHSQEPVALGRSPFLLVELGAFAEL